MSKAKLKKYLQTLSKEQVIEVMLELYFQKSPHSPSVGKSFPISKN